MLPAHSLIDKYIAGIRRLARMLSRKGEPVLIGGKVERDGYVCYEHSRHSGLLFLEQLNG